LRAFWISRAKVSSVTIAAGSESGECSAWARRSAAIMSASAVLSAMISSSEGPAGASVPTMPKSWRFADATYFPPGPTMTSHLGIQTPKAKAAIAWAPPTCKNPSAPASHEAARVSLLGLGPAHQTSSTPATFAGTTVMIALEGRGKAPPGT